MTKLFRQLLFFSFAISTLAGGCQEELGVLNSFRAARMTIEFDPTGGNSARRPDLVRNGIPVPITVLLDSTRFETRDVTDRVEWEYSKTNLGSVVPCDSVPVVPCNSESGVVYLYGGVDTGHQEITAKFLGYETKRSFEVSPVEFVTFPGDTFLMGTDCCLNEAPAHWVYVSDFSIGKYEVTNREYAEYLTAALKARKVKPLNTGPPGFYSATQLPDTLYINTNISLINFALSPDTSITVKSEDENKPVVGVTWFGALAFARHYGIRLPTEAEWEYACRGKTTTLYFFGNNNNMLGDFAVCNNLSSAVQVGTKKENLFGLFDVYGNAAEWCFDYYQEDYYANRPSPDINPMGPDEDTGAKVIRGGSYSNGSGDCRSARRDYNKVPDCGDLMNCALATVGFRVAK